MKDANDLLVAGMDISDVPSISIDMYCAEQVLARYPDDQPQQYKAMQKYISTVTNELIKSDIAVMVANVWNKDVADVRKQLSVRAESVDEKLKDFADVYSCFSAIDATLDEEELGIGYAKVDSTVKFRKKWVVLLGAYSGSGKSNNVLEWIIHWVVRLHKRVLFFSLEMSKEDAMLVIIGKIMNIPMWQVRDYVRTEKGAEIYRQVAEHIGEYLYIIDKNSLSIDDIEDYIKLANARVFDEPVDIVAVDYFGYLKGATGYDGEAAQAKRMKEVAKNNNVALIMLVQLNKASQTAEKGKASREPTQNDLKGAGDIGASADVVYLIWRPVMMGNISGFDAEQIKYDTMLKIAKARGGLRNGLTHFKLVYNPETGRLSECTL